MFQVNMASLRTPYNFSGTLSVFGRKNHVIFSSFHPSIPGASGNPLGSHIYECKEPSETPFSCELVLISFARSHRGVALVH